MKFEKAPDIQTIRRLFGEHIETHRKLPESARLRDFGGEKELIRDYSGRVVYELLQNALDRCEQKVLIALNIENGRNSLIIGNDGSPVSAHDRVIDNASIKGASDFHALLSLHSSTKSASESIGNKGVGFRSVFASSSNVAVWSRCSEGAWWSLEMAHPCTMNPAQDVSWDENLVASFYNPSHRYVPDDATLSELLGINESLQKHLSSLVTLVVLSEIDHEYVDDSKDIVTSIRQLQDLTLGFLGEKYPEKRTVIDAMRIGASKDSFVSKAIGFEDEWIVARGETIQLNDTIRQKSGLELDEAKVIVALPPPASDLRSTDETYYWSYLPTEQLAGFGVHIHADFYLNNSRRNVTFRFGSSNEPQFYNGSLLQSAAKAIVLELWSDTRVLARYDFWQLVNPNSCKCEQLKNKVAEILLQKEHFTHLVAASFPIGKIWKLGRYKDLFKAILDWTDYLYRHNVSGIEQNTLTRLRERYWSYVRDSRAAVFPVIGILDDSDLVADAIALPPKLEAGGSGRDVNVYYRSPNSQDVDRFELPDVIKRQKSYVTSFRPEGMSDSDCGMVEYNRVEILGRLKQGTIDEDHSELLKTALKLATERAERGEQESVLDRCLKHRTPGWRFILKSEANGKMTNLLRASLALCELHVPTLGGEWLPAHSVTVDLRRDMDVLSNDSVNWPWPIVDSSLLKDIASEIESAASVDVDSLCMLFGIVPGPLLVESNAQVKLNTFGERGTTRNNIFTGIVASWDSFLGPLFRPDLPLLASLCKQIQSEKWIPTSESAIDENICGGILKSASGYGDDYIEPHRIWFERPQGGFRTKHLTILCPREGKGIPNWARQCGIVELGQDASAEKIITALQDLKQQQYNTKDISELYGRLIKSMDEELASSELPVLARYFNYGRLQKVDWARTGDSVYFDNGDYTTYISGFENIAVWAVRRHKQKIAKRLGITTFNPNRLIRTYGDGNPDIELLLQRLIARAMPDIIAATRIFSQQSEEFDEDNALAKWASIQLKHYEDVWMELEQAGLNKGHMGHKEAGNIFPLPESNTLVFDLGAINDIHQFLLECAAPLAEVLCESKVFTTVFSQVLTAWSHAGSVTANEAPASVLRLRRDFGIDAEDLADVTKKIETYVISGEEKEQWRLRINRALSGFGDLNRFDALPGITITQDYWVKSRLNVFCTQQLVQDALRNELTDISSGREFLIPVVDFSSKNRQDLINLSKSKLNELLAQKAVASKMSSDEVQLLPVERSSIISKLESLNASVLSEANPTEEQLVHILGQLVGIEPIAAHNVDIEKIIIYLRDGIWPIDETCIVSESLAPDRFDVPTATAPLKPMTDDARLMSDRQKSIEGAKAEAGLLSLAKKRADEWRQEDEEEFWAELSTALAGNPNADIQNIISSRGTLDNVLHVSKWWGNAGFDVLVPEKSANDGSWTFFHVEVKRVNEGNGRLQFHLSENERIKAMDAVQKDPLWRLWLISLPDCKVRDITTSLPDSTKVNGLVTQLKECGMSPDSYLIKMKKGTNAQ